MGDTFVELVPGLGPEETLFEVVVVGGADRTEHLVANLCLQTSDPDPSMSVDSGVFFVVDLLKKIPFRMLTVILVITHLTIIVMTTLLCLITNWSNFCRIDLDLTLSPLFTLPLLFKFRLIIEISDAVWSSRFELHILVLVIFFMGLLKVDFFFKHFLVHVLMQLQILLLTFLRFCVHFRQEQVHELLCCGCLLRQL